MNDYDWSGYYWDIEAPALLPWENGYPAPRVLRTQHYPRPPSWPNLP